MGIWTPVMDTGEVYLWKNKTTPKLLCFCGLDLSLILRRRNSVTSLQF